MNRPGPSLIGRRSLLAGFLAAPLCTCRSAGSPFPPPIELGLAPLPGDAVLTALERRAFDYFWETTPSTGLVLDRWPRPSFCSIAAVGFGLSAYLVGAEEGYITRDQARARVLATVRFFHDAPQGSQASGVTGYQGFFFHFLDAQTGLRYGTSELSPIDTALLLAGLLHCQAWFDGTHADEALIRSMVDDIYGRMNWPWLQVRSPWVALSWTPEDGFSPYDWQGYDEASILYLLAIGSPTHPLGADAWKAWTSTYETSPRSGWVTEYGQTYLRFPPLFGHQFTQCWVDMRGIADAYMKGKGIDYFENSRRATYAQQAYALANPSGWTGYGQDIWGITACDGPGNVTHDFQGSPRQFHGYAGRGMGGPATHDDGTLAPYAAGASVAFTPEISLPALAAFYARYGGAIYGRYGFYAFNPSFTFTDVSITNGGVVPGLGWVNSDFLGIELGPLLAMIGNYRGEWVWKAMRQHPAVKRGLQGAGFTGGWLG
jgi:hypothetical protein